MIIWSVDNESVGRSFPSLCLFFLSCLFALSKTSSSMSRTGHESGQLAWLLVFGEDGWYFTTGRDAIWKVPYACPFSDSWNFHPSLTCESLKNKSHGCWILRLLFPHWFKQAYLFFSLLFCEHGELNWFSSDKPRPHSGLTQLGNWVLPLLS